MECEQIIDRLTILEAAIRQLKEQLMSEDNSGQASSPNSAELEKPDKSAPRYIRGAGRFANDPVFDEIVRLGRESRESPRPGPDNDYCL